jgi:uncharacterized protein YndB with AHSA1/START domain
MLKMTTSVCIDAPATRVWDVLSDLERIHLWVRAIRHAHCPAQNRGVGAVRVCELKQATIRDTIVEWDEGRSFTYKGEGAPMLQSASNQWTVEVRGSQTLVTTSAEVPLASLKYLVENGQPYKGHLRDLMPVPANC